MGGGGHKGIKEGGAAASKLKVAKFLPLPPPTSTPLSPTRTSSYPAQMHAAEPIAGSNL